MTVDAPSGLLRYFSELEDPRMNRTRRHPLTDILTISICAFVCGANGWTQVEEFGRAKLKWFRTFLLLPNGIEISRDGFTVDAQFLGYARSQTSNRPES